jgi:hypothetical protein
MTYAQGGLIQATDYNGFVASVNAIWGTGSGDAGYGQSTTLSTVAASNTVTATQWSTLISRLNSISTHQSGSGTGITSPSAGNVITYLSTLSSTISTLTTNRLNYNNASSSSSTTTTSEGTSWSGTCDMRITFSFSSANAMRYFFNCGGRIRFTAKNSALAGNLKSTDWDTLVLNCGTVQIFAQQSSRDTDASGSPTINNTNLGFYDLTTSEQVIVRQYSTDPTGGYSTNNYADFSAWLNASPGSATAITVRVYLVDGGADGVDDTVIGTTQMDAYIVYPEVTNIANVWGTGTGSVTLHSKT